MNKKPDLAGAAQPSAASGIKETESTCSLIERHRSGDPEALNRLFRRYLPPLSRWASHRLPQWAWDLADTQDLVQETLLQTLNRMDVFEPVREGALQAYLRQALMNRIRDEIRRCGRRPGRGELDSQQEDDRPSPLEEAIGREATDRYEKALAALRAVHEAGRLHRDVKAQNVMFADSGRLVLMDFGTGRGLDDTPNPARDVAGTPLYIAPEIFAGHEATALLEDCAALLARACRLRADSYCAVCIASRLAWKEL